jgi:hypothetical protein
MLLYSWGAMIWYSSYKTLKYHMIEIIGQAMWKDSFERWNMKGPAWWICQRYNSELCLQWMPFGVETSNHIVIAWWWYLYKTSFAKPKNILISLIR